MLLTVDHLALPPSTAEMAESKLETTRSLTWSSRISTFEEADDSDSIEEVPATDTNDSSSFAAGIEKDGKASRIEFVVENARSVIAGKSSRIRNENSARGSFADLELGCRRGESDS